MKRRETKKATRKEERMTALWLEQPDPDKELWGLPLVPKDNKSPEPPGTQPPTCSPGTLLGHGAIPALGSYMDFFPKCKAKDGHNSHTRGAVLPSTPGTAQHHPSSWEHRLGQKKN